MRRREFIAVLGGAVALWPLAARAQQTSSVKRVGYLGVGFGDTPEEHEFRQGLRELGYVEGQNLIVEHRRAREPNQLSDFAAELVNLKVDVIFAEGSQATAAARQKTTTIPITTFSTNPVGLGFVASLAKPGGNITGVSLLGPEVSGKRLEMLKRLLPNARRIAALWNPDDPAARFSLQETQVAAQRLSLTLQILEARNVGAFDKALLAAAHEHAEAVVLLPAPLFVRNAEQLAALALPLRLPTANFVKESVRAGVLMSYGADFRASARRAAYFVHRILNGANPADLPVEQPTKFELAINLKTARALGITVPSDLLTLADEVVE